MADRNGDGIVYHRSDCSEGYVRWYGFGGDGPCSTCETWGLSEEAIKFIHQHPDVNTRWETVFGDCDAKGWKNRRNSCGCDVCKQHLEDEAKSESFIIQYGKWIGSWANKFADFMGL